MIKFNVLFLIISMIPIPPLDGSKIYFGSRMTYMFVMPAIIAAAILLTINIPVFLSIVISLLIAVILWIVYYISFENKVWTGPR
jgi:Zn-dependent protease